MKVIATVTGPIKKYVGKYSTLTPFCCNIPLLSRQRSSCITDKGWQRLSYQTSGKDVFHLVYCISSILYKNIYMMI